MCSSLEKLKVISVGKTQWKKYEELIGEIIKLCFFRTLTNVKPKERNSEGIIIRDWIASNRAESGFWEMVRQRHKATQIVWECKNYRELKADDFHQCSYYLNKVSGSFGIIVFRGDKIKSGYYSHLKRISIQHEGAILLLLRDKDIFVFLRQAINGKIKEDHINDIYDRTVRAIS